ncbi:hypothetical protein RM555_15535 [Micromonospora sp. DSM 115977]|uniref:Uncharacterized protein n=1 Tax=Micromonospora reichwaldensis TaxID=3075516 RepID=A0ABU2WWU6_9ACTN|nr:hypothetical protein [Micromonospora sp. DSM 115977]MDT0530403.1 hypothetical protein [Micromonospora sp. DSM 115977]
MTIQERDVRGVLRRVTDDLVGPPTLLDDVRRGGRRRLRRRRAVLAAVCAVVVAVPVGGALHLADGGAVAEVASPLFDGPTRGDLAGDGRYLRQVRQAWRDGAGDTGSDVEGDPHVVWAGNTPAGPAAYVAQRATATGEVWEPAGERMIGYAAFVEPTADGPRVMTRETVTDAGSYGSWQAALLGPRRDVLVVLDAGKPVEFSPTFRYAADGRIERTFQRVKFRDGAAVLSVPPQRDRVTVALVRKPVSATTAVHIANAHDILLPDRQASPQRSVTYTLPGAERVWGDSPAAQVGRNVYGTEALAAYVDPGGMHREGESPHLVVYGATPDGRQLLLESHQYDDDPTRAIALLAHAGAPFQPVASGFIDWNAPLPVRLRLPDGQGVLVAAEGAALSYRVGAGEWHDAGRGAALLPADATEVRVTATGGTASTVRVDS